MAFQYQVVRSPSTDDAGSPIPLDTFQAACVTQLIAGWTTVGGFFVDNNQSYYCQAFMQETL